MSETRARRALSVAALLVFAGVAQAQVFPPRTTQSPSPSPPTAQPAVPGALTQTVPLAAIMGDLTRSFVHLVNMQGPAESNYMIGRGLRGRLNLERRIRDIGNGSHAFLHVSGLSNPPQAAAQGSELRLRFVFPSVVLKTFHREYSAAGDSALADVTAEFVLDVFLTPTADQRGLPAVQNVRVLFQSATKPAERCIHMLDLVYPVNVCALADEYLKDIKLAVEHGLREGLMHPQARQEFEQAVGETLRADLLARSGASAGGPARVDIVQAAFRGTDYVVSFVVRQ